MAIEGKVATILNERELTINRGAESGVKEGMTFKVVESPVQIVDPETETLLGELSREKIRVKISEVHPKFSVGRTFETYQTYDSSYPLILSQLRPTWSLRTITKVRTLRTKEALASQTEEVAASVQVGDAVIEV